ncbi:ABC transporter permease [Flavisolibacter ginsenosidimutans]|uniref:ABC transporter permease n=1 Tax=Flavisolibacter ginsenosidimutans TaxID=661481 RepID=A0A5B8UIM2_9BACT|nr:ABC transporter permease [Flavisolibacter ginsenosidimutans]QEC56531.1 ABC transporter permease [Flavisolibacter ginsenosidimutans]
MKFADLLSLSFHTVRSNRLRSGITVAIIALGITALVGIITAIGAMNQKLTESFSNMGANGFTIRFKDRGFRVSNNRELNVKRKSEKQQKKSNLNRPITLEEAESFAMLYRYPSQISLMNFAGNNANVSTASRKTNPTVALIGGDENYLDLNGFSIQGGRNLSRADVVSTAAVCLLGYDVAKKLFGDDVSIATGKEVRINNGLYKIIGVLKSRGSTFGFSRDNVAIVGYKNLAQYFAANSFAIGVKTSGINRVEQAMGEAEGTFRNVRKLSVTEESNFVLERSNSVAEKAMKSLGYITAAVTIIGLITLIGAAIGLMNIMLVAVTERTKEVGLIKAIGGKRSSIHTQFLTEAVLLSLAGAVVGIALGIVLGNLFGIVLQTAFVVPWNWIVYGVVICTVVGLAAGLYPALKAGRLNPVEALRYE